MRKLLLVAVLGLFSLAAQPAQAQVSVNVNIGTQPQWGPRGYDHVDYYYLPEIESYYYVPSRQFVYLSGNRWIHSRRLPSRYRNYDLYGGRKVVINSPRPWLQHRDYRTRYVSHSYDRRSHRKLYSHQSGRNDYRPSKYNNSPSRQHQYRDDRGNGKYKAHKNDRRDRGDRGRGHDNRGGRGRD